MCIDRDLYPGEGGGGAGRGGQAVLVPNGVKTSELYLLGLKFALTRQLCPRERLGSRFLHALTSVPSGRGSGPTYNFSVRN